MSSNSSAKSARVAEAQRVRAELDEETQEMGRGKRKAIEQKSHQNKKTNLPVEENPPTKSVQVALSPHEAPVPQPDLMNNGTAPNAQHPRHHSTAR